MKNLFDNLSEIKERIESSGGAILLFDFDGVLSAIAPTPDDAFISKEVSALLLECASRFPVAIITGRTMADIKKKINEKNIFYIATHGLEWEEDGQNHAKEIPKETLEAIGIAKEKIKPLLARYPSMIMEDKASTFTAHYRTLSPELVESFIQEVNSILRPIAEEYKLRLDHSTKAFELRPEINWDKGDSALFAEQHLNQKISKKFVPIYLGDSDTDEDAFKALEKNGIGIRVNSKENEHKKSAAKWFMKDQSEITLFLKWILSI